MYRTYSICSPDKIHAWHPWLNSDAEIDKYIDAYGNTHGKITEKSDNTRQLILLNYAARILLELMVLCILS